MGEVTDAGRSCEGVVLRNFGLRQKDDDSRGPNRFLCRFYPKNGASRYDKWHQFCTVSSYQQALEQGDVNCVKVSARSCLFCPPDELMQRWRYALRLAL